MLVWAAGYAAFLILVLVVVAARREPTAVRGDWLFLFTSLFLLAATIVTGLRGDRFGLGTLLTAVLVVAVGWFVRSRWLIIGASAFAVGTTIGECAARLRAPVERSVTECSVAVPGGAMRLRIASVARGSTMIVFVMTPRHRKAELFRRLLAKQYRPVLPTIKLGTLGGGGAGAGTG